MRVMGIDPSTKTGLVVLEGDTLLHASEVEFPKLVGYERLSALAGRMMEVHDEFKPDVTAVEQPFVGHASSGVLVIEISTVLRYFLWQADAKFFTIPPTSLKKWVCDAGNAKKELMLAYVYKRWGYMAPNNNVCDAYALARYGQNCPSGPTPKVKKAKVKSGG